MIEILLLNSVFYDKVLLSYSYQCFTTKTPTQDNTLKPQASFISPTCI